MLLVFVATMCVLFFQCRTKDYTMDYKDIIDRVRREYEPIQWNEEMDDGYDKVDDYFDRLVMVGEETSNKWAHPPKILTTGVILDDNHVLTSYNPYRAIVNEQKGYKLVVAMLRAKKFNSDTKRNDQLVEYFSIVCYSQVPDVSESMLTKLQWHGGVKVHSPVHDLFVLQTELGMNYTKNVELGELNLVGPKKIPIATMTDWLGPAVKFASLGYKNKAYIESHNVLNTKQYEDDDYPLTDCEEWMIKDWGWFLCVKNKDLNKGIGSGAVLIFNETLVGIGSFTLKKRNSSVFVFTDVRPYLSAIFSKCTRPG